MAIVRRQHFGQERTACKCRPEICVPGRLWQPRGSTGGIARGDARRVHRYRAAALWRAALTSRWVRCATRLAGAERRPGSAAATPAGATVRRGGTAAALAVVGRRHGRRKIDGARLRVNSMKPALSMAQCAQRSLPKIIRSVQQVPKSAHRRTLWWRRDRRRMPRDLLRVVERPAATPVARKVWPRTEGDSPAATARRVIIARHQPPGQRVARQHSGRGPASALRSRPP